MSGKVWVIEEGEYSDYRVVGVYSCRANAERVLAWMRAAVLKDDDSTCEAKIAEWALDPAVDAINAGLCRWRVLMRRDGTTETVVPAEAWVTPAITETCRVWDRPAAHLPSVNRLTAVLVATVWAADAAHAVKVVNERRARMIAMGKWPAGTNEAGRSPLAEC